MLLYLFPFRAQAFADMWIFVFNSDHMRNLLVQGKVVKSAMLFLCREYMKMVSVAEGMLADMECIVYGNSADV